MTDTSDGNPSPHAATPRKNRLLELIGALRLVEGMLVLTVAIGVLRLVHHDVASTVAGWSAAVRIDPHNEYLHALLARLGLLTDDQLKEISAGSFIYGGLKLIEGYGLWRGMRWAEYLTSIAIGLMIPVEIHELMRHATVIKALVLVINVAIVIYLIVNLRRTSNHTGAVSD